MESEEARRRRILRIRRLLGKALDLVVVVGGYLLFARVWSDEAGLGFYAVIGACAFLLGRDRGRELERLRGRVEDLERGED